MISGDPWLSTINKHQWLCGAAARGTPKKKKKKLARSNASWEDLVTIVNCFLKKKKKSNVRHHIMGGGCTLSVPLECTIILHKPP